MINSKKYNPKSYEAKRLEKEIKHFQEDIKDISAAIEVQKETLRDYINAKDLIAKRIRSGDHEGYKDEDSEMLQNDIDVYERVINDSTT